MASREVDNRIFVGSLSWETDERQLEDAFSRYGKILEAQGNTAVYLLYAHARICSIIRKSGKVVEDLKETGAIVLAHPAERAFGLHLLQFAEILEEACSNLLPNVLCEYLYNLSENFTTFYTNCQDASSRVCNNGDLGRLYVTTN